MDVVYIGGETLQPSNRYKHHADVLRTTPYAAFGGQEGVIGSGDLKVVEGSTPGGFVNVNPGVVAVLGRGPAQDYEMYVAKSEVQESVSVTATDSSGSRSDLVISRVVDPEDGPAGDTAPSDTVNGPYAYPEIIEGVDPSTTSLADTFAVHGVKAGFALARLDIPASTSTITSSEIVGLRGLASPLRNQIEFVTPTPGGSQLPAGSSFQLWPAEASWTVRVPPWATTMSAAAWFTPQMAGNAWGSMRFVVNSTVGTATAFDDNYIDPGSGGGMRIPLQVASDHSLGSAEQGSDIEIHLEGQQGSTTGTGLTVGPLQAARGCVIYVTFTFKQELE